MTGLYCAVQVPLPVVSFDVVRTVVPDHDAVCRFRGDYLGVCFSSEKLHTVHRRFASRFEGFLPVAVTKSCCKDLSEPTR